MVRFFPILAATLLAASAAGAQTTLRTMITSDIRGLMPGISTDDNTGTVLQQVYEGLVAWRADGTVAPMLADKIDTSADGGTYSFTLREGVTFHNGAPLTAKEVAWTWRTFLDPKSAWPCRANFDGTRTIKITAVEAEGDRKVVFRLAAPAPAFLSTMARADCDASGIAHPDSVGADGTWSKGIGTGPFKVGEWRRGDFIELAKHEQYASRGEPTDGYAGAKAAKVDRLRFTIVPDPSTAKAALLAGNLDLWSAIDPKHAKEIGAAPGMKVATAPVASLNTIVMQTKDPALQDKRLRQAINIAVDRPGLSEAVSEGYPKPSSSPVPVSSRFYGPVQQQGYKHDPAEAKRLATSAGYKGQPLKLTTNNRFAAMHDIAIVAQAMARAAGINLEVEVVEFATQLDRYLKGNYQLMVWNYTPYLDPMFALDRFVGDKSKQPDRVWSSPQAIELLTRLGQTAPEAQQPIWDELHRLFVDEAPMIVWSTGAVVSAWSDKVSGYEPWAGRKPRFWNVAVAR
jgi:peptide/nickel transport system substrate-binding protein